MSADKWRQWWRLPEETTEMILARLPADDIARFKLVCKNWRSLISSPGFVSAHLKHSQSDPSNHRILIHDDACFRAPPGILGSVFWCGSTSAMIVGSVNGLICTAGSYRNGGSPDDIRILNPLTLHSIKLPPPPSPVDLIIVSDDSCSRVTFAFWCDSVTNANYKVARIVSYTFESPDPFVSEGLDPNPNYPHPNRADVWDSGSPETWTEIPIGFGRPFLHHPFKWVTECDIVVGGCAYWIVVDFKFDGLFVLSLDLDTLVLKPISLPHLAMNPRLLIDCLDKCRSFLFLTNRKGKLGLVARKENWTGDLPQVDEKEVGDMHNVWTLKDNGSSGAWNPPISIHVEFFGSYLLKYINGKLLLWRAPYDRLTSYDMETQSFEDVAFGIHLVLVASAHDFVGSIVTINGFKTEPDICQPLNFVWPIHVSHATEQ